MAATIANLVREYVDLGAYDVALRMLYDASLTLGDAEELVNLMKRENVDSRFVAMVIRRGYYK